MTMTISGSGTITGLTAGGLPDATITQAEIATPVVGTGPAFSAYASALSQSVTTAVATKVQLNTETFDTNNNFDPVTNYRFTPTVSGYYQVNFGIALAASAAISYCQAFLYKNGALYMTGSQINNSSASTFVGSGSDIVFMNGTTDYIELYGVVSSATSPRFNGGSPATTYMSACLVRAA